MFAKDQRIAGFDDEVAAAINEEARRQEEHIELIASENYASPRVMEAQGGVLTNKYAEGYPGKRYYGGCEWVDRVEVLAIERVKALFGAHYANVQPHSGSQANAAAYLALLEPGDTILGMSLDAGGHLTHGAAPSFSGKVYNAVQSKTEKIGRIYAIHAKTREEITRAGPGDIVSLVGMKHTKTGDSLCDPSDPLLLEKIKVPESVIQRSVTVPAVKEEQNLHKSLRKLSMEDPSFHFFVDSETQETIIAGMGELHLEIIQDRLRREFNVPVVSG